MSLKLDDDIEFNPSQNILLAIRHLDRKRKSHNLKSGIKSRPTKNSESSDIVNHINMYKPLYFFLGIFFVLPLISFGLVKIFGNIIMFIVMPISLYGMFIIFKYIYPRYEFLNQNEEYYMKNVIFPMLKSINSSFTKEPNSSLREKYKTTLRDVLADTNYSGTVSANINGVKLSFSKCHYHVNEDEYSDTIRFCYVADFNKNLTSDTIISSIPRQEVFSKKGYKKISLDNARFNEEFSVHTKDEIEARYILTPKFMEKLLKINEDTRGIYFFGRNKIVYYGYFNDNSALFYNIDLTKNIYESTKKSYERLRYIINFVNELNLDSKIWK